MYSGADIYIMCYCVLTHYNICINMYCIMMLIYYVLLLLTHYKICINMYSHVDFYVSICKNMHICIYIYQYICILMYSRFLM